MSDSTNDRDIHELMKNLSRACYIKKAEVVEKLAEIGEPIVPTLLNALVNGDYPLKTNATDTLVEIGEPAVPYLIDTLKDKDEGVRIKVAWALWKFAKKGVDVSAAIPLLMNASKHDNPEMRRAANATLYEMPKSGYGSFAAIPAWLDALKDEDREVRYDAVLSSPKLGDDLRVVLALIDCLKYEKDHITRKITAPFALYEMAKKGVDCSMAVPTLIEISLKSVDKLNSDPDFFHYAIFALGGIGDIRALPTLFKLSNIIDYEPRYTIVGLKNKKEHEGCVLRAIRHIGEKGNYTLVLKKIKDATREIMEKYKGKKSIERKEELAKFESLAQDLHNKMSSDKKAFHKPVEHQSVRAVRKKVIRNG